MNETWDLQGALKGHRLEEITFVLGYQQNGSSRWWASFLSCLFKCLQSITSTMLITKCTTRTNLSWWWKSSKHHEIRSYNSLGTVVLNTHHLLCWIRGAFHDGGVESLSFKWSHGGVLFQMDAEIMELIWQKHYNQKKEKCLWRIFNNMDERRDKT